MSYLRQCQWYNLKQLNLNSNKIGVKGVSALSKMDLISLSTLDIGNCGLGVEAVRKLVRTDWP